MEQHRLTEPTVQTARLAAIRHNSRHNRQRLAQIRTAPLRMAAGLVTPAQAHMRTIQGTQGRPTVRTEMVVYKKKKAITY